MQYLSGALWSNISHNIQTSFLNADNNGLWQQALEEQGLNKALGEFRTVLNDSVKGKAQYETAFKMQGIRSAGTKNELAFESTENNIGTNKQIQVSSTKTFAGAIKINPSDIVSNYTVPHNIVLNVESSVLANTPTKTLQETVLSPLLSRFKWLDKNTVLTLVNADMEVWIRDANLSDVNLSQLRKALNLITPNLNAKLVKVAINGKVIFNQSDNKNQERA